MKRNLSSSALNLQAMTVAMAATELRIPFHLSIRNRFGQRIMERALQVYRFFYFFFNTMPG